MSTDYRVEARREDIQIELDGLMEYLFMQFEAQELPGLDKSIAKTQARIKELEAELNSENV
jgi:hypothetical protein